MSQLPVIGIDLGTSFSSVARLDATGRPVVIENAEGEFTTPSVVYYGDHGPLVGREAVTSGRDDPARVVEHAKRALGEPGKVWTVNGTDLTPVQVSADILRKLKEDAVQRLGPLGPAVISVPVGFTLAHRQLTLEAGRLAGLDVVDVVNEPVAAALTFLLAEEGLSYAGLAEESKPIVVYDLGGGTFDLSLVRYGEAGVEVLSTLGDLRLGGIDWDERLAEVVAKKFEADHGVNPLASDSFRRRFMEIVEGAKRSLSNPKKPWTGLFVQTQGREGTVQVTRDEFEAATADLLARTRRLTDRLVKAAGLSWHKVEYLLPVGGASRMPMVREIMEEFGYQTERGVPGSGANYALSPDLAVAQGAALYAGLVAGPNKDGGGWFGRDVSGLRPEVRSTRALGLMVRDDADRRVNHVLIPRDTLLPATARVRVTTLAAGQTRISLKIVEGEDSTYRAGDVLGKCVVDALPPDLPAHDPFEVDLTYEASGLVSVRAHHLRSGLVASASVVCG